MNTDHIEPGAIVELPAGARFPHRHATLWLDTEFNGWGGELISLALVDDCGGEFYEALELESYNPWVLQHVVPVLGKPAIPLAHLQLRLQQWLQAFDSVHIVADWPDDVAYLCRALITGPGERLDTPALTFEIRRDLDATSAIPHNALEDAKAMRARHLQLMALGPRRFWPIPGPGYMLSNEEATEHLKKLITQEPVQASERCERKNPANCWHVRCQLGGVCQHRSSPNDPAAHARGWGEGGESCVDALNAQERLRDLVRGDTTSGAGVAGADSASGASMVAAGDRPRPPAGGVQWPVTDEYVDAIGYESAAPIEHVIEGCCGLLQCPGCPAAAGARK